MGGGFSPCAWAKHRIDLLDLDAASRHGSYKDVWGDGEPRCRRENHFQMGLCAGPWPSPDRYFDFVVASQILEDVRDPLRVVREIARAGRAGYVETHSRARESSSKWRFFRLRRAFGRMPEIGWDHHRWLVECEITDEEVFILDRRELEQDLRAFERGYLAAQRPRWRVGLFQ